MLLLLLILAFLAILLFGFGFTLHILFWIALVALVLFVIMALVHHSHGGSFWYHRGPRDPYI